MRTSMDCCYCHSLLIQVVSKETRQHQTPPVLGPIKNRMNFPAFSQLCMLLSVHCSRGAVFQRQSRKCVCDSAVESVWLCQFLLLGSPLHSTETQWQSCSGTSLCWHYLLNSNSNQTKFRMYRVMNLSFQNRLVPELCTQECLKLSIERKEKWTKSLLIFWWGKTVKYAKEYKQGEKSYCKMRLDLISGPAVRQGRIDFLSNLIQS